jgi:hypothetical protein
MTEQWIELFNEGVARQRSIARSISGIVTWFGAARAAKKAEGGPGKRDQPKTNAASGIALSELRFEPIF